MQKAQSILFVHNSPTQFVRLDLDELRERYQVTECYLPARWVNPTTIWQQVKQHDLVFGWFASWHTCLPIELARLLGKPSVLIIGGYDLANMPEIGYGHQRGGIKKWISRRTMRSATCLVAISHYSQKEAERNGGLAKGRVHAVYLGVPDHFGNLPQSPRQRMVLTVGNVDCANLRRKGHEAFVRAAALMPDVNFVLAGAWKDGAVDHLRSMATPNVTLTGWLSDEELRDYYRKAAVYVQASLHEGFGLSVAEAMLAGCIPVVTRAGALPEVTGELGIFVKAPHPGLMAQAIEKALASSEKARLSIRRRILDQFPMEERARRLHELIGSLITN